MDWKKILLLGAGGAVVGSQLKKIIQGIGCGFLLLIAAFFLVYYSVAGVKEDSKTVDELELQAASDVTDDDRGLVKLYGVMDTDKTVSVSVDLCDLEDYYYCDYSDEDKVFADLLYYEISYQRFEIVQKERGTEDDRTYEYEEEWVDLAEGTSDWAELDLDGIALSPSKASLQIDMQSEEVLDVFVEGLEPPETFGQSVSEQVGQTRAMITYLDLDNREYTVVGELRSGKINSGDPFIISDLSEDELESSLKTKEKTTRLGARIGAWIVLTIGFTMILSPILAFTDLIPVVGGAARSLATLISAIISAIIILLSVFLLNYWWIVFGSILIVFGLVAFKFVTEQQQKLNTDKNNA